MKIIKWMRLQNFGKMSQFMSIKTV